MAAPEIAAPFSPQYGSLASVGPPPGPPLQGQYYSPHPPFPSLSQTSAAVGHVSAFSGNHHQYLEQSPGVPPYYGSSASQPSFLPGVNMNVTMSMMPPPHAYSHCGPEGSLAPEHKWLSDPSNTPPHDPTYPVSLYQPPYTPQTPSYSPHYGLAGDEVSKYSSSLKHEGNYISACPDPSTPFSSFHHFYSYRRPSHGPLTSSLMESGKTNQCRICGKTYARPSTLKTHMRTHSGEKPYECETCNKKFSQAANLTAHMRTHSGEKPFNCPVCNRKFSQSSSVTTHMRTHSGDRPYRCRFCKKAFSDSSTLTKHLRIHSGEKPYQCKICFLRFSQSGNLNRHMRVHSNNA